MYGPRMNPDAKRSLFATRCRKGRDGNRGGKEGQETTAQHEP